MNFINLHGQRVVQDQILAVCYEVIFSQSGINKNESGEKECYADGMVYPVLKLKGNNDHPVILKIGLFENFRVTLPFNPPHRAGFIASLLKNTDPVFDYVCEIKKELNTLLYLKAKTVGDKVANQIECEINEQMKVAA